MMSPAAVEPSNLIIEGVLNNIKNTAPSLVNGKGSSNNATLLAELDASLLEVTLTDSPRTVPHLGSPDIVSQRTCTDHMVSCQWTAAAGWATPKLHKYGPLEIMPSSSCLQYATQCFEGLKLYRGYDGQLRLFRPDLNAERLLFSATRIALPAFPPKELLTMIERICAVDGEKWLSSEPGTFLYLRPTMIANDPALGVRKPSEALLYVILAMFPPMDQGHFGHGLKVLASREDMVRAWPGGFGSAKLGANYGPTLIGQAEAQSRGFDQVLWLFGPEGYVTEAGAANFFVVWRHAETNKLQLVTAPLSDGLILNGVTRRSVMDLTRERLASGEDGLEVVEQRLTIGDIIKAFDDGRLLEAFVSGTAYFIVGVEEITWNDRTLKLPVGDGNCGTYARKVKCWLQDIMYGKTQHDWAHVITPE
jgi:branched-chain amino acid aminotransferase